jgi:hypothetical protein
MFNNKKFAFLIFLMAILSGCFFNTDEKSGQGDQNIIKTKIAACPTLISFIENLDKKRYEIIATNSTSESISLLNRGLSDFILAGRTLKPGEPKLDAHIIKKGYSFLSDGEKTILKNNLHNYNIYSDLELYDINQLGLGSIAIVEDVYQFLDKGIIVTAWENTNYLQAEIVHVLENNGNRFALSRQPALYCPISCETDEAKKLISIFKNN